VGTFIWQIAREKVITWNKFRNRGVEAHPSVSCVERLRKQQNTSNAAQSIG